MNRNETISLLLSVGRIIRSHMVREMPLSYAQCEVLTAVAEKASLRMRDIASHLKIAAPSATSIVDQLVHEKYIERKMDATDRRQIRLTITHKGKNAYKRITETRKKVIGDILSILDSNDTNDLNRILTKIISA